MAPGAWQQGILMASELAAGTLHAQAVAEAGGGGNRLVSVVADVEGEPIMSAGPAPQAGRPVCRPGARKTYKDPAQRPITWATRW